jgi:site-specific DNA-methyltransferase (adenine-specific)
MIETNKVYEMDAFELLKQLPDNSIDLVLTDPPYNTTQLKWDSFNPETLWS